MSVVMCPLISCVPSGPEDRYAAPSGTDLETKPIQAWSHDSTVIEWMVMTVYDCWTLDVPVGLRGALSADLWTLGTLGIEEVAGPEDHARYRAYFAAGTIDGDAFWAWRARGVAVNHEVMASRDWLAVYRASAQPSDVGEQFRVDPRDPIDAASMADTVPAGTNPQVDSAARSGRHLLRIPARQAFGTGSHATTRLALAMVESLDVEHKDVLDVGTGSGILAFAALILGARRVVGFDLDTPSVLIAGQNAVLNRSTPALYAGRLDALRSHSTFDLALVNVLPERIRGDLPRLDALLSARALLVSSGNLVTERDAVLATWSRLGWRPRDERTEGEWVAFVLRREDGA